MGVGYFDELGGDDAIMTAEAWAALAPAQRDARLAAIAETMAPSILATVDASGDPILLRGRYAVHNVCAELSRDGRIALWLMPRRALALEAVVGGGPNDPSRRTLAALPHGVGGLLDLLLDSVPGYRSALRIEREQVVYALDAPTVLLLSQNAALRLTSIAHLVAYITHEIEQRWPEDPQAPLRQVTAEVAAEQHFQWQDEPNHAPPVPGYGAPPIGRR